VAELLVNVTVPRKGERIAGRWGQDLEGAATGASPVLSRWLMFLLIVPVVCGGIHRSGRAFEGRTEQRGTRLVELLGRLQVGERAGGTRQRLQREASAQQGGGIGK
jgi:hypothetical protein